MSIWTKQRSRNIIRNSERERDSENDSENDSEYGPDHGDTGNVQSTIKYDETAIRDYKLSNKIRELYGKKSNVRKCLPIRRNIGNYYNWEYAHDKHLLSLRKIFMEGLTKLNIYPDVESSEFIDKFNRFIYKCSSGEIYSHME